MSVPIRGSRSSGDLKTYLGLLGLLGLTWALARFSWGGFAWTVGLAIAFVKVGLIARDFMELKSASSVVRVAAATGTVWLAILFSLSLTDYFTRNWMEAPSAWPQKPPGALVSEPALRH